MLPPEKMPAEQWESYMSVYRRRAGLEYHLESARRAAALAAEYPEERDLQCFAAQTAYYCAHRVKGSQKREVALEGVRAAERVLALAPEDYEARVWLILTTFRSREGEGIAAALKEAGGARDLLEELVQNHPDRFEAYMMLGAFYRELPPLVSFGDTKRAVALHEKGVSLAPQDPEMLLEYAMTLRKARRKKEAKAAYRKVIEKSIAPPMREWETEDARQYARKQLRKFIF
jgi:tetratricopeptide (TPR) repeat protein